jgi:uncharacterized repeat protein (TIGR03803 family)
MTKLNGWTGACAALLFCAATAIAMSAQTFTTVLSFDGSNDGSNPTQLIQGLDGNLYGATQGGAVGAGTLIEVTTDGTVTKFLTFKNSNGDRPVGLLQLSNGTFIGTTSSGGAYTAGTIFKVTRSGLKTIYSFCPPSQCSGGSGPQAGLVQAPNGNFFGTTCAGGLTNHGTLFQLTAAGTLTILHNFNGNGDGICPTALVVSTDGNLYGTTHAGGINNAGTFFKYGAGGAVATLYSFSDPEPAGLMQGPDGDFYGVTWLGGANGLGTVFKLTAAGAHTTLYNFCSVGGTSCTDGEIPQGGVIQATDGNLYGTTVEGGAAGGYGTIFSLTPAGTLTTLHSFDNTDGSSPQTLIQATNGTFYGTAQYGGSTNCIYGCGTIFSLSMGMAPFTKENANLGKVGGQAGSLHGPRFMW